MLNKKLPKDFNPQEYLELNPDVRDAGVDPKSHYLSSGQSEGRHYKKPRKEELPKDFNAEEYLDLNPDVRDAGVDPISHYLLSGRNEGREYKRQPLPKHLKPQLEKKYQSDGLSSIHNHDFMVDTKFVAAYKRGLEADGTDYGWHWRVHIGLWSAQSAVKLEGDFVECGVNKGFLSSAIMSYLDWSKTGKTFYLLDTFNGIDERFISDSERQSGVLEKNEKLLSSGFYTTNLDSVRNNFSEWDNVVIIPGAIPETLMEVKSQKIAFLHIDLNCSPPEIATIEKLWPKIVQGGIVLLDDYAYYGYQTQKLGMDEWSKKNNIPIVSLPTGQGLIIKT